MFIPTASMRQGLIYMYKVCCVIYDSEQGFLQRLIRRCVHRFSTGLPVRAVGFYTVIWMNVYIYLLPHSGVIVTVYVT